MTYEDLKNQYPKSHAGKTHAVESGVLWKNKLTGNDG